MVYQVSGKVALNRSIKTDVYIKPATINQKLLVKSIKNNTFTFATGFAGTGKTLLSLFTAVALFNNQDSPIEKILYARSNVNVQNEKDVGALPGDLNEKLGPLAYPVIDNLINFMNLAQAKDCIESGKIEIIPTYMMRGRTFSNTFILLDESQNTSYEGIKTTITRVGSNSKMVVIGDTTQADIYNSGLSTIVSRLKDLDDVGIIELGYQDIMRNPLLKDILKRLER